MEKQRIALYDGQKEPLRRIRFYINKAVKSWVDNNESHGVIPDNSDEYYEKALKIAQEQAELKGFKVEFDYPGLYPTFEITGENGEKYTEYNEESFFKRINGFWD